MNDSIKPRGTYTSSLPPTSCTREMSEAIRQAAIDSNTSVAEIQRIAFALFLREFDRKPINVDTITEGGDMEGA